MRVVSLTTLFPNHLQPNFGVFVRNRVVALSEFAEVEVVAPVPWAPPLVWGERRRLRFVERRESICGLEVHHPRYLVVPRVGRRFYGAYYYWSLFRFMQRLHAARPFDLLDVHWAYPDGYAGVALARDLGVPVSVSLRGSDIHTYPKDPARRRLIAATLQQADLVVPVARSMVPLVEALGVNRDRVSVVANGVDRDLFFPVPRAEARERLGLEKKRKIVLGVGRLERPKRFDLLIRALRNLPPGHDPRLILVGKGSLRGELEALVRELGLMERVFFAGEKHNRELGAWYSAADLLCLPSDDEGCPNVVLEAISCGTPVVASDVGGVRDLLEPEKSGILAPDNRQQSWDAAMGEALARPWEQERIAALMEGRSWRQVGRSVHDLFQGVVEQWRPLGGGQ